MGKGGWGEPFPGKLSRVVRYLTGNRKYLAHFLPGFASASLDLCFLDSHYLFPCLDSLPLFAAGVTPSWGGL